MEAILKSDLAHAETSWLFAVMVAIGIAVSSVSHANVAEAPGWTDHREPTTCDFWFEPLKEHLGDVEKRLENGLCAGEIFAVFTVLEKHQEICPPTDLRPKTLSLGLKQFIERNPGYAQSHSLLEAIDLSLRMQMPCTDGSDVKP